MADKSNPHNQTIFLSGFISGLLLIVSSVALTYYFKSVTRDELRVKVELAPARELEELRLREERLLGTYTLADAGEENYVRIPIERAMRLDPRKPIVPAGLPAASAPTTGPQPVDAATTPTADAASSPVGGGQEG